MKLTPIDVRQKHFKTAWRGLDGQDVEAFLDLVASELEETVKENHFLQEELKRRQSEVEEHRERGKTLQETMLAAQRVAEEMKEGAKKQSEITLAEAELQAEKIVQQANTRLVQLIGEINELKRQRAQFEVQVRSVVEAHQKLLETFAPVAPTPRIEDNVAFLAKK